VRAPAIAPDQRPGRWLSVPPKSQMSPHLAYRGSLGHVAEHPYLVVTQLAHAEFVLALRTKTFGDMRVLG
jgi:hypothetical protein